MWLEWSVMTGHLVDIVYYSPIKMVSGDVPGVVTDGPDTQLDIDYEMDVSEVTVTFGGYESERNGVTHYQWAVGSAPRLDDVMPFSYINLVEEDGGTQGMLGKMTQNSPSSYSLWGGATSLRLVPYLAASSP